MMGQTRWIVLAISMLAVTITMPTAMVGQASHGVAVVRVGEYEYTIPIECDDAARPEMGFSTEPPRRTRERTGRTSGVNLRVRTWQETDLVIVSLDRYVTWMRRPPSTSGVLTVETGMSPMTVMRDRTPVAYTYEMWNRGDRPVGLETVRLEARCDVPERVTPSVRRIGSPPERNRRQRHPSSPQCWSNGQSGDRQRGPTAL
jgi:hypothetical protein